MENKNQCTCTLCKGKFFCRGVEALFSIVSIGLLYDKIETESIGYGCPCASFPQCMCSLASLRKNACFCTPYDRFSDCPCHYTNFRANYTMISNARVITTLCVKLFKDKRVIVEYISLNYMKFFLDLWNSSGEEATYSQRISILKKFIKELGHNKSIDEMIIVVEKMAKRMGLNKYERTKQ